MGRVDIVIPSHCPISAAYLMPVPSELLSAPLDYIAAEHDRQRCVCAFLKQMAAGQTASRADAEAVIAFLTEDLRRHHDDEDHDLFPALRRRALPEDALEAIIDRLVLDHEEIDPLAGAIVAALKRQLGDRAGSHGKVPIGDAGSKAMLALAESMQQHLSVEDNIVLVIARKRLKAADLAATSRSMIARRGASDGV